MSKKKNNDGDFGEMLNNVLSNFSTEDLEKLESNLDKLSGDGYIEYINDKFYNYERPDYASMAKPLSDYLVPLYDVAKPSEVPELCDAAEKIMAEMSAEAREADVRNFIINILANAPQLMEPKDRSNMPLIAAFSLMETFNMTGLCDILIELLRQDMNFFYYYFNAFEDALALILSEICLNNQQVLQDYMLEVGRIPDTKCIVCDAVVKMVIDHPERRLAVMSMLSNVFERYAKINIYEPNIDLMVFSLAQIKAYELCGVLEKVYKAHDIPSIRVSGGFKGAKKLLKNGTKERTITDDSVKDIIDTMAENFDEDADYDDYHENMMKELFGDDFLDDDETYDDSDEGFLPFDENKDDDRKK